MYLVSVLDSGDERILRTKSVLITEDIVVLTVDKKRLSFPLFNLTDIVAADGMSLAELMKNARDRRKMLPPSMIVEE